MKNKKKPLNLVRWFSTLGLIVICITSALSALVLSRFLEKNVLHRDASVTMDLIQSIMDKERIAIYFSEEDSKLRSEVFLDFFEHIEQMPEIQRANIYSRNQTIIWSSKTTLIGAKIAPNKALEQALQGKVAVTISTVEVRSTDAHLENEYAAFERYEPRFVENYIPLWNRERSEIVGVIEVYKRPDELLATIVEGKQLIWRSAILSGFFLYATLFWVVYHASTVIRRQHKKLIEVKTLATIGEMSSSIAHNLRNPLASIRSSAELALSPVHRDTLRKSAEEIILEVDALDVRIRTLLSYGHLQTAGSDVIYVNQLICSSTQDFALRLNKLQIRLVLDLAEPLPSLIGDITQLRQAFDSLLSNAVEAMLEGGVMTVRTRLVNNGRLIQVVIIDTGIGMTKQQLDSSFLPFLSSKKRGLGLGLPIAKRIIKAMGGTIKLESRPAEGTTVIIKLPR